MSILRLHFLIKITIREFPINVILSHLYAKRELYKCVESFEIVEILQKICGGEK